jgi:hypothetical protein
VRGPLAVSTAPHLNKQVEVVNNLLEAPRRDNMRAGSRRRLAIGSATSDQNCKNAGRNRRSCLVSRVEFRATTRESVLADRLHDDQPVHRSGPLASTASFR